MLRHSQTREKLHRNIPGRGGRPRNAQDGALPATSGFGQSGSLEEGRLVQFWIGLDGQRIRSARSKTLGCPSAIAAASVLAERVEGLTLDEARGLTTQQLADLLNRPTACQSCTTLALEAMQAALSSALVGAQQPDIEGSFPRALGREVKRPKTDPEEISTGGESR